MIKPSAFLLSLLLAFAATRGVAGEIQFNAFRLGPPQTFSVEEVAHVDTGLLPGGRGVPPPAPGDPPRAFVDISRHLKFEIQVLSVDSRGAQVRWILREFRSDEGFLGNPRLFASLVNTPLILRLSPEGEPLDIDNWAELAPVIVRAVQQADPAGYAQFKDQPVDFWKPVVAYLVDDLSIMAQSQLRGAVLTGNHTLTGPPLSLPPGVPQPSPVVLGLADSAGRRCEAVITMAREGSEIASALEAEARVSTSDGWLISLYSKSSQGPAANPSRVSVLRILRETPATC